MEIIDLIAQELSYRGISTSDLFRFLFFIEFAILGVVGVNSLLKSITLDKEIRGHFAGRLEVFAVFFEVYQSEQRRLVEEAEEEEAKKARLRDLRGEGV